MPMIEKDLAESLVDLRLQQSLGHDYCPIQDVIDAVQAHYDHAFKWSTDARSLWARIAQLEAECDDAQHANLRLTSEVARLQEHTS
jgi:hypothetical protein